MNVFTPEELAAYDSYLMTEHKLDNSAVELIRDAYSFARLHVAEGGSPKPEHIWDAFSKSPVYTEHYPVS
jgi:hypothetical protein